MSHDRDPHILENSPVAGVFLGLLVLSFKARSSAAAGNILYRLGRYAKLRNTTLEMALK